MSESPIVVSDGYFWNSDRIIHQKVQLEFVTSESPIGLSDGYICQNFKLWWIGLSDTTYIKWIIYWDIDFTRLQNTNELKICSIFLVTFN